MHGRARDSPQLQLLLADSLKAIIRALPFYYEFAFVERQASIKHPLRLGHQLVAASLDNLVEAWVDVALQFFVSSPALLEHLQNLEHRLPHDELLVDK